MTWPPVSSQEVAERRERAETSHVDEPRRVEDLVEATGREDLEHDASCVDGWLGEDDDGRPIPCLVCRPHLRGES